MKKTSVLLLIFSLLAAFNLTAQPNVDICITYTGGNNLAVKIRPDAAFSGQFSNLEFTVNPPSGVSLSVVNAQYGIALQSGTIYGHANAQSVNWTGGAEETVLNLSFSGGSGTGNFTITGYYCELNGLDKSGTVYCSVNNVVLPLELLSFSAKEYNRTGILNWQTVNEIDLNHFEIEKSSDGYKFQNIGIMKKDSKQEYRFVDEHPFEGTTYYRLKIIENTGAIKLSKIQPIAISPMAKVRIYPNPTSAEITIDYQSEDNGNIYIQIIDLLGNVTLQKHIWVEKGQTLIPIVLSNIADGFYNISIYSNNRKFIEKIFISK